MSLLDSEKDPFAKLYDEFEHLPELIAELNEHFAEMDGAKNADEFSRCLVFFMLGRMYEQKYGKGTVVS